MQLLLLEKEKNKNLTRETKKKYGLEETPYVAPLSIEPKEESVLCA